MSGQFRVDLLHPGAGLRQIGWLAKDWEEWFVGPGAVRRFAQFALGCLVVLVVILFMAILLPTWRLSGDLNVELPKLRRDLAARQTDLGLLRSNLGALSEEARRQVRWGELLTVLGREIPSSLKLATVEATSITTPPAPGQPPGTPARFESVLRIDAVTPVRPGSAPLLDVAQFMAGLMRDPVVSKRYQLRSWDVKPAPGSSTVLNINIVFAERAQ